MSCYIKSISSTIGGTDEGTAGVGADYLPSRGGVKSLGNLYQSNISPCNGIPRSSDCFLRLSSNVLRLPQYSNPHVAK